MSQLSEIMSGPGADTLLAAMGERIELRPGGVLTAIVSEERLVVREDSRGRRIVRERNFTLHVDAASRFGGVEKPAETLEILYVDRWKRTFVYEVSEIPAAAAGLVTLAGVRHGRAERTREGARGGK